MGHGSKIGERLTKEQGTRDPSELSVNRSVVSDSFRPRGLMPPGFSVHEIL